MIFLGNSYLDIPVEELIILKASIVADKSLSMLLCLQLHLQHCIPFLKVLRQPIKKNIHDHIWEQFFDEYLNVYFSIFHQSRIAILTLFFQYEMSHQLLHFVRVTHYFECRPARHDFIIVLEKLLLVKFWK